MSINSFKDLIVWQKAMDLSEIVYRLTETLPPTESYNLSSQIRRSAISIPSNIAEGHKRGSKAEYKRFLLIALGSSAELETQLLLVERIYKIKVDSTISLTTEI